MTSERIARRWRPLNAVGWGLTWSFGVALGVALGGYVTATSGAGAPGADAVESVTDLVLLPAAAGSVVLVVYCLGAAVIGLAPRVLPVEKRSGAEEQGEAADGNEVERNVGGQVPAAKG